MQYLNHCARMTEVFDRICDSAIQIYSAVDLLPAFEESTQ
jgi:hypothetical protein